MSTGCKFVSGRHGERKNTRELCVCRQQGRDESEKIESREHFSRRETGKRRVREAGSDRQNTNQQCQNGENRVVNIPYHWLPTSLTSTLTK